MIFIHSHPRDEAKNLNVNEHITTNRPLTQKFSKMEAEINESGEFRNYL